MVLSMGREIFLDQAGRAWSEAKKGRVVSKEEVTEAFIKECIKKSKTLDEQQIREHVQFVLNRTRRNRGETER